MNVKLILALIGIFFAAPAFADNENSKQCFHLNAESERDVGYCQAVRINDTLHVSGSVGLGEMPGAIRMAYDKLTATLQAHGLDWSHVVKETVFATDLEAFIANKSIRNAYYADDYPAATWVQVDRLYLPSFVVEVEITAQFPEHVEK
ncbi:MAG: RidA family protein [Gammaproteobacteria bacterium]